jgi:SnoaL-like domain
MRRTTDARLLGTSEVMGSEFWERQMKKVTIAVIASALLAVGAMASTGDMTPLTAPIRQFIDGFNSGDVKSAYAAYAAGDITIVDEFAPHSWTGPHAPQEWAADYEKNAKATGVSEGIVKYGAPTRTEVEHDAAYVIVPTTYLYKEHGKPLQEEGQMTFVLHSQGGAWKISSWTWSGVKPHPAKK